MSLYERRPDIISHGKPGGDDRELRSSVNSDMSIDNDDDDQAQAQAQPQAQEQPKASTWQPPKAFATFASLRRSSTNNNGNQKDEAKDNSSDTTTTTTTKEETESSPLLTPSAAPAGRRLSVQDRINLFEKKQKENSSGKPVELRRLSSDVLRRWSGASDMSIDVSGGDKKGGPESPLSSSSATSSVSQNTKSVTNDNPSDKVVAKTDQGSSQESFKVSVFDEERSVPGGFKDQVGAPSSKGSSDRSEVVVDSSEDGMSDVKFFGGMMMKSSHVVATSLVRAPRSSSSHSRSLSAQFEGGGGGVGLKSREASSSVVVDGVDQSTPQPHLRSSAGEPEDSSSSSSYSSTSSSSFSTKQQKDEVSQVTKVKYQKPQEQTGMALGKRDEIRGANEGSKFNKQVLEAPSEQLQRVRQSKGNQGLHDELKMKADELEKLFAEHKLRVPGDQSGPARRIEPADARVEQAVSSQSRRTGVGDSTPQLPSRSTVPEPAASSSAKSSVAKTVDSHSYGDALRQNFLDLSFGDDSRGKFYEKYMKKRNAKLQEEWSSNRAEKEARMKAMQDSLERSRAEMKAKFSGSINRQSSVGGAHRAEKLGYFKSSIKRDQVFITCFVVFVINAMLKSSIKQSLFQHLKHKSILVLI